MGKPRRTYLDGDYGQLHVRVAKPDAKASEPPLYCLHMSPKSGRQFEAFMTAASDDRIVVAPDYPGYGESDHPPETPHVSVVDYARNVWLVADALGHEKIDLFGSHTGSKVAAEMAHQRADKVGAIVMVSAAILSPQERAEFDAYFSPIPLDKEGSRFRIMWERIIHHRGPGMTLEMMADSMAENLRGGDHYEWGHRAAFAYGDRFDEIVGGLPHPITILNPADELQEATRRASAILRNGRIQERPEWGHGFLDAFTDDVVETVKEALSQR